MQAVDIKRFAVHRIGIAAVAVGTLATVLVGANALYDATREYETGSVTVTRSASQVSRADTMRFLEWNTNLPAISVVPVKSAAEIQFLEMNTMLPDGMDSTVRSLAEIRFLELNTLLPGVAAPKVQPYDTMRFLEINQLPGDDASYLPSPSDVQPVGAEPNY